MRFANHDRPLSAFFLAARLRYMRWLRNGGVARARDERRAYHGDPERFRLLLWQYARRGTLVGISKRAEKSPKLRIGRWRYPQNVSRKKNDSDMWPLRSRR
jgi:hypothetical protein